MDYWNFGLFKLAKATDNCFLPFFIDISFGRIDEMELDGYFLLFCDRVDFFVFISQELFTLKP